MRVGIVSGDRIHPAKSPDGKEHWGGAGWVRLGQYLPHFGYEVVVGTLIWYYTEFKVQDNDGVMHDVDVLLMQRLMHDGLADHIKKAQAIGQVIINDVDDWYWGLDPTNMAWKASHPKHNKTENTNFYRQIIGASSLVTTSTPFLYDKMSQWNRNVLLLPNTVDTKAFAKHDHTKNSDVVIGWTGSTAHRSGDLETLRGVLPKNTTTQNTTTHITYLHGGHHTSSPSFAERTGLPSEMVKTLPACDPQDYPNLFQMDIGIAPLRDVPFNHAKSEIKLLEYSASGIPWVASALSAYTSLSKEFGCGRVASRPREWIKHLNELIGSRALRQEEGERLYELVKTRDVATGGARWNEVLSQYAT